MISKKKDRYKPNRKVINVTFLQDERLSYKARGVLGYLLSKPKNWKGQIFDICNNSEKDGKTAIKSAMKELEFFGYAKLKPFPRKDGKFQGWYYEIYDTPKELEKLEMPKPDEKFKDIIPEWLKKSYLTPWPDEVKNNQLPKQSTTSKISHHQSGFPSDGFPNH